VTIELPHREHRSPRRQPAPTRSAAAVTGWSCSGSFTTPPCTDGVTWLLLDAPIEAGAHTVAALEERHPENYRPEQLHHGRAIEGDTRNVAVPWPEVCGAAETCMTVRAYLDQVDFPELGTWADLVCSTVYFAMTFDAPDADPACIVGSRRLDNEPTSVHLIADNPAGQAALDAFVNNRSQADWRFESFGSGEVNSELDLHADVDADDTWPLSTDTPSMTGPPRQTAIGAVPS
jgi:hypothetical protein